MALMVLRRAALALLLVAVAAILSWRGLTSPGERRFLSYTSRIMATPVSVTAPEQNAAEAAGIVFDVFHEVEAMMSEWQPGSPLSAVNRAAGSHPVAVPEELRRVIHRGQQIGDLTGGAFDITWAALWGLWDFTADTPRMPDPDDIASRLALVDSRAIVIDDQAGTVSLPRAGMLIGLGGIAKGTALDRSAQALRDRGIEHFLISAGGQVVASGMHDDRPWRVGIRDPRGSIDDAIAEIDLTDTGSATSGDYERYFILDGTRYHHVLDPRTGMPARGVRSATVICADAELADALSTALMILGPSKALELVERLEDVEAVLVDDQGQIHTSSGLRDRLRLRRLPAG